MTTRIILLPHALFLIGAVLWLLAALVVGRLLRGAPSVHRRGAPSSHPLRIAVFLVWLLIYPCLFLFLAQEWMRAVPTAGWREKVQSIDTAVVLGFGFEEDAQGRLQAGRSNEFLLRWTLDHTRADTLLVQEGVWAAYNAMEARDKSAGTGLKRIHRHIEGVDMNTFQTAFCALERMEALGKRQAVLVAHDLQLQRAAWIFEKLKMARPQWADLAFVVPEIPATPFPADSAQLRTRFKLFYVFCELFGSRVRDHWSAAPDACRAPL